MTIAGSDSSAGAGIQADIKTFQAMGVYGVTALTAVTSQTSSSVRKIHPIPSGMVFSQIETLADNFTISAAKTGLLCNGVIAAGVARLISAKKISPLVVDPVISAHGGRMLISRAGLKAMIEFIFPLAAVITPNVPEAEKIAGMEIGTRADIMEAAKRMMRMGPRAVLIKGGHGARGAADWLYDGKDFVRFGAGRIRSGNVHGTGCVLSAAIAAALARGQKLHCAVETAKRYVSEQIRKSWAPFRGARLSAHR
jgi:hydroxymethylpyrimidine/phosphomethylpyrimidine kinase